MIAEKKCCYILLILIFFARYILLREGHLCFANLNCAGGHPIPMYLRKAYSYSSHSTRPALWERSTSGQKIIKIIKIIEIIRDKNKLSLLYSLIFICHVICFSTVLTKARVLLAEAFVNMCSLQPTPPAYSRPTSLQNFSKKATSS